MSTYQHMDHAAWMEANNRAIHSLAEKEKPRERKYKRLAEFSPVTLTDFQKKVCDIIGMVGGGIYNAPIARSRINWNYGNRGVSVMWKHDMATFDFNELTALVFLCHEARIRCDISAGGPGMMRISFWQRSHEGSMSERHPNLDEAVKAFREYLPTDHRIIYKADRPCPGCGHAWHEDYCQVIVGPGETSAVADVMTCGCIEHEGR